MCKTGYVLPRNSNYYNILNLDECNIDDTDRCAIIVPNTSMVGYTFMALYDKANAIKNQIDYNISLI